MPVSCWNWTIILALEMNVKINTHSVWFMGQYSLPELVGCVEGSYLISEARRDAGFPRTTLTSIKQ